MTVVLGIDFGTSNSCMTFIDRNNTCKCILTTDGRSVNPTVMYFDPMSDEVVFGESANTMTISQPKYIKNRIANIKRLIGVPFSEYLINQDLLNTFITNYITKDPDSEGCCFGIVQESQKESMTFYTVTQLVELYIAHLLMIARNYNQGEYSLDRAVITVPSYFTDTQRCILTKCFETLGVRVLRIINEPTAAILAYRYINDTNNTVKKADLDTIVNTYLVIDCGGGTTDFSVVQVSDGVFDVLDVYGDNFLGGQDITNMLTDQFIAKLQKRYPKYIINTRHLKQITEMCERAKCVLSYTENTTIILENAYQDTDFAWTLSRVEFLYITNAFFERVEKTVCKLFSDDLCDTITDVVLVGGTTRIPRFTDICRNILGDTINICKTIDPDTIVSVGAAVQAKLLISDVEPESATVLLDIVPMTLGIKTVGGIMAPIISKGTVIPTSRTQVFRRTDDSDSVEICIYQGNRRLVKNNCLIQTVNLDDLAPRNSTNEYVHVTFSIDTNGRLTVTAVSDNQLVQTLTTTGDHTTMELDEQDDLRFLEAELT